MIQTLYISKTNIMSSKQCMLTNDNTADALSLSGGNFVRASPLNESFRQSMAAEGGKINFL